MALAGAALACAASAGCAAGPRQYLKTGFTPPERVAVLPLNNHTTDLDGPQVARYWFDRRLSEKKNYRTLPLEEVDARLKELGITDGGQLESVTPRELGAALSAPAVIYGELLDFNYQTTGFLNVRKARARFKMVDCATGETLWENEGLGVNSSGALSASGALQAGLEQLGKQLAEKAFRSPLKTETMDMVWNAIQYLPRGR